MAKRPNLSAFTTGANPGAIQDKPAPAAKPAGQGAKPAAQAAKPPKKTAEAQPVKSTTIRLPDDAWKQAKRAAFDLGVPTNDVYTQALDDWFEKNGLPRLAAK